MLMGFCTTKYRIAHSVKLTVQFAALVAVYFVAISLFSHISNPLFGSLLDLREGFLIFL